MSSKILYHIITLTLILDVLSCHLVKAEAILPKGVAYYSFFVLQAIVMYLLFYQINKQLESIHTMAMMAIDKYTTRCSFLFYILVPFAIKQVIDEACMQNERLDMFDYPLLLLTTITAISKYYPSSKAAIRINTILFNLPNRYLSWMNMHGAKK